MEINDRFNSKTKSNAIPFSHTQNVHTSLISLKLILHMDIIDRQCYWHFVDWRGKKSDEHHLIISAVSIAKRSMDILSRNVILENWIRVAGLLKLNKNAI